MTTRQVVLLVGSAKAAGRSTSEALAKYLAARFERSGAAVAVFQSTGRGAPQKMHG